MCPIGRRSQFERPKLVRFFNGLKINVSEDLNTSNTHACTVMFCRKKLTYKRFSFVEIFKKNIFLNSETWLTSPENLLFLNLKFLWESFWIQAVFFLISYEFVYLHSCAVQKLFCFLHLNVRIRQLNSPQMLIKTSRYTALCFANGVKWFLISNEKDIKILIIYVLFVWMLVFLRV